MGWVNVLVHTTLLLSVVASCGVLSYFLLVNMCVITEDTIAVTVTDTKRVIKHVIAITAPSDNELESKQIIHQMIS